MEHYQVNWGRPREDIYGEYNSKIHNASVMPAVHTQEPIVTGTSVIAIKYNDGVMMAADNLASYGSLARFDDQERLVQVGKQTVVGISGDISDLQHVERLLEQLVVRENYENEDGGHSLTARHVFSYLSRQYYGRRSKLDPLWNAVLVAGFDEGKPFLSYVDLLGVSYSAPALATGFGAHLAVPLLRQAVDKEGDEANLSEEDARALIDKCMKVLFYRDARSIDKYSVATLSKTSGVKIEHNVRCKDMSWKFASDIQGYGS